MYVTLQIACYFFAIILFAFLVNSLRLKAINNDNHKGFSVSMLVVIAVFLSMGLYISYAFNYVVDYKYLLDSSCNHTISGCDVENYSNNLEPKEYIPYYSTNENFYFFYPPHLFYQARCIFEPYTTNLGENIESHFFEGSNGTTMSFTLSSRIDGLNKEEAIKVLEEQETSEITTDTLNKIKGIENGYEGFVITGYNDSGMVIYKIYRVYEDCVMGFKIVCPPFENEEDRLQKRYVTECIAIKCSFLNDEPKDPRSFHKFVYGK